MAVTTLAQQIVDVSHHFGHPEYARAGGGNASYKADAVLHIKPSGTQLATLRAEDLIPLRLDVLLDALWSTAPTDTDPVRAAAARARVGPDDGRRPSVEILFHALLPEALVLHLHPLVANALACQRQAHQLAAEILGDQVVVVDYTDPGVPLARAVAQARTDYTARTGRTPPGLTLLRNHGIIAAGDTAQAVIDLVDDATRRIQAAIEARPERPTQAGDAEQAAQLVRQVAPVLRGLLPGAYLPIVSADTSDLARRTTADAPLVVGGPLIPDQIVYAGSLPAVLDGQGELADQARRAVDDFQRVHGHAPQVVVAPGQAVFAAGVDQASAANALAVFTDQLRVARDADRLGAVQVMNPAQRGFIETWEAEAYRQQVAKTTHSGRLAGRVALVTGAAQGFGLGIAEGLAGQGAHVGLADLNLAEAERQAERLAARYGAGTAWAVGVDVADAASFQAAVDQVVARYGGIDLFVSNAGVARAGGVVESSIADFDLVTAVNYKGYFLGVRAVAPIMAAQHRARPDQWFDIIEINSKSGLEGSKRNFAYAGSKFGGIGLTQSFALELLESGIKVNSVCPGNYLDGPLWSDPERGLFVQYLAAGKVPGARTVADVRAYYQAKVPMGRGCLPEDVVRAVLYLVEQQYETGQALPVTGGQVMIS
jgi:NAD(P)-dependent dehydrogenase (short-subunit alcohol dehydrogenase family)/rhamnose utilization protein RhaD (predicted bifunctional aldolase and dehydrogenase)